ncbi:hypothetical protein ACU61A_15655 [Pseudonocardia sichuanensis]
MPGSGLPPRAYPVERDGEELRFSNSLLFDVAEVLVRHGYPAPGPHDLVDLGHHLLMFIHGERRGT